MARLRKGSRSELERVFHGPLRNETMREFERESIPDFPDCSVLGMARELVSDLFKHASRHRKIAQTGEAPGGRAKTSVFAFKERLAGERSQQSQDGPQSFDRQPNLVLIFFAFRRRLLNTRDGALDQFIDDTTQSRAHALVPTEDQLRRFHGHGVDKPPKRPKMRLFALGKCEVNAVCEDERMLPSRPLNRIKSR
jgi:hypothetical protein